MNNRGGTKLHRLRAYHDLARMNRGGGRQVTFTSLYGPPDAETPIQDFQALAAYGYGSPGYSSPVGPTGVTGNAVLFNLIDKRMAIFTEARFKFRALDDKHLFGTEELKKLEEPWPDGVTGDLLARMEQDASLAGNAWIRDCGDNQLERLRPDWVTIISRVTTDANGGQVRRVIGVWYDPVGDLARDPDYYPISEIAHWAPVPDPLANFRGMSWITPVIRELNGDIRMTEYREAYFRNAATPNLVIKYDQKIAPERIDRLKNRLRERHTGPDGAFQTLVLDEGADLTVVGKDMQGSAFDALQAAGETRMAGAAGVPPLIAGLRQGLQASQIGQYKQAMDAFIDMKIRPNWRGVCAALAKLVNIPPGAELWYDTSDVSAMQTGEQEKAGTLAVLAETMSKWIMAGYEPDSVTAAAISGDPSKLKHSGLVSVQMQKLEAKTAPELTNLPGEPQQPMDNTDLAGLPKPQVVSGGKVVLPPPPANSQPANGKVPATA
jgi:Phage portal protein